MKEWESGEGVEVLRFFGAGRWVCAVDMGFLWERGMHKAVALVVPIIVERDVSI